MFYLTTVGKKGDTAHSLVFCESVSVFVCELVCLQGGTVCAIVCM